MIRDFMTLGIKIGAVFLAVWGITSLIDYESNKIAVIALVLTASALVVTAVEIGERWLVAKGYLQK